MGIYKVKDTWYIDFYADGRRIRKAVGSRRDAENALAAVKADILRGEYRFKKDRKIRFEDFAKEYIEFAKINKRSWLRDECALKKIVPHFEGLVLSKITPHHIEEYKKSRLDDGVTPGTINRELSCLKYVFTVAERFRKFDGKNPVKEVKPLQERKFVMKILAIDEIRRLCDAANGHIKPIIILALNTGMRKGEILGLKWNDVDFVEHYIYVKETKSNIMRKIPMNSVVSTALKAIEREGNFMFISPKTRRPYKRVFYPFKETCRKAKIEGLRFHDLRHTAATLMVMGGIDLVTVKEILGHSTIEMTMRYSHPTPENKRKAVEVLASVFEARHDQEEKSSHNMVIKPN